MSYKVFALALPYYREKGERFKITPWSPINKTFKGKTHLNIGLKAIGSFWRNELVSAIAEIHFVCIKIEGN